MAPANSPKTGGRQASALPPLPLPMPGTRAAFRFFRPPLGSSAPAPATGNSQSPPRATRPTDIAMPVLWRYYPPLPSQAPFSSSDYWPTDMAMPILGRYCPPRPARASCHFLGSNSTNEPSVAHANTPPKPGAARPWHFFFRCRCRWGAGGATPLLPCLVHTPRCPLGRPWSLLMGTPGRLRPCSPASSTHRVAHWAVLGRC